MHGVGAKLSKHVLGMKFMRKTKDQLDKDKVEKTHREHFAADIKSEVDFTKSPQTLTAVVEEVPSYSQCIGYNFGRVSFGGFNPTVEYNVSRGIWKAARAGVTESDPEDEVKSKDAPENDVSDEEMVRTYGSIVGTLGKHFMNKRDRKTNEESKQDTPRENGNESRTNRGNRRNRGQTPRSETSGSGEGQGTKKRSGWIKGKDWKKSQNNDYRTGHGQGNKKSQDNQPGKSGGGDPPQKKRKFWKPND